MRFYTTSHRFYAGIDLHTRTLSLCVLDDRGVIVCQRTLPPKPDELLVTLAPFRDGLVVARRLRAPVPRAGNDKNVPPTADTPVANRHHRARRLAKPAHAASPRN